MQTSLKRLTLVGLFSAAFVHLDLDNLHADKADEHFVTTRFRVAF